ncbi:MAG: type II secretion system protein J, partial [Kiritimatiellia bacterium]
MKAYSERVRGFTLVEILVAASISVLVLTGVSAGLVNAMRTWRAAA